VRVHPTANPHPDPLLFKERELELREKISLSLSGRGLG